MQQNKTTKMQAACVSEETGKERNKKNVKRYLKFAGGRRTKTIIMLVIMSLTLVGAVEVQRNISIRWLTRTRTTTRVPYSRTLNTKIGQVNNEQLLIIK